MELFCIQGVRVTRKISASPVTSVSLALDLVDLLECVTDLRGAYELIHVALIALVGPDVVADDKQDGQILTLQRETPGGCVELRCQDLNTEHVALDISVPVHPHRACLE
ncbi:MAG: hypothetical protein JWN26_649 [Candidatus Saccharibacteria bacterium]|nr:hypothetical protein [Candidatus Saccharibacteria bacterium]